MGTPHDQLFRILFERPEQAAAELQLVLPRAVARHVDWSTLRLEPGSFVEPALRQQHADLLYSVQVAGRPAFVYVLLEHKSRAQSRTVFQLLVYMVRIWQRWLRGRPRRALLPPILPVIVHHGRRRWRAARAMIELYDLDPPQRESLAPLLPGFQVVVDDLAAHDEQELWQRALPAIARLCLLCLRGVRTSRDLRRDLGRWSRLMREVLAAPSGADALVAVFSYIMEVRDDIGPDELRSFVRTELGPDAEEQMETPWTRMKKDLREEGRAEGRAEVILRLLTKRFGPLPGSAVAQVRRASAPQLDAWAERILEAATLEEALGG